MAEFKIGTPIHQTPRQKEVRRMVVAPGGLKLAEFDFSGQEARLMAIMSQDPRMLSIFAPGGVQDMHSVTGAEIGGIPFDRFMARKKADDKVVTGPKGLRYQGKFTNLSSQYRISVKTLRRKARVDYGFDATYQEAARWDRSYHNLYRNVKRYWKRAIQLAKAQGYAETIAGRRYYLPKWKFTSDEHQWGAEQTSINFPIQGTGADMKELGIVVALRSYDFLRFAFDLHDGLFFWVPVGVSNDALLDVKHTLSNLPYQKAWNWEPPVLLPVDCQVGPRWGELEEI